MSQVQELHVYQVGLLTNVKIYIRTFSFQANFLDRIHLDPL